MHTETSMNWYNLYKQASPPLPVTVPKEHRIWGVIEELDDFMNQETADKEQGRNQGFLGVGAYGLVSDIGDDKVIKYTIWPGEAESYKRLIGKDTEYPIVKVYSVDIIQDNPKIWGIVMEKVQLYEDVDPLQMKWKSIANLLRTKLAPIGLAWDVYLDNVGFDKNNNPVLLDLGERG